ncbi:RNA polymerase sigma factor [Turicibacter sp. TJ11]|uniref:RNA polymerase sigma factor n=1 Tax=Turicibacter sp. TJ11 TaxID=2806443 RepID=UPI001F27AC29|nr:sigma-70 family RNA polymerase sigma factor [Turicibacter sp. TJ11]
MNSNTHEPIEQVVERLIEDYGQEVYRIAYFYIKDRQLAEDVFQEVFYKVMKNYHKFQHQSSEKTWLTRITINTCKDLLRTNWIKRVTTFSTWQEPQSDYEAPFDIEKQEEYQELYQMIQKLPTKYKDVILLFYYKELSYEEISQILGIPEGTVRSRLARARTKLKKMISEREV